MSSSLVMVIVMVAGVVFSLMGILAVVAISYRRVPAGQALLVSKMQSEPTVSFSGAIVLPIVHRGEVMDISVKSIELDRRGAEGIICRDNIRADIKVTFWLRVNNTRDDVLKVARSVGCERASDLDTLHELFGAKFAGALKTVAKQLYFEELYTRRDELVDQLIAVIGKDLNGFVLDDVAIDYLEQTPLDQLDPNNILDAQGIAKIRDHAQRVADGEALPTAPRRKEPKRTRDERLRDRLRQLGVADVAVSTEVSCEISKQRAPLSLAIDNPDDERVAAQLPPTVPRSVLSALGSGELVCADGRASFRWPAAPTEEQLVAGARLVYAFRETER